MFPVDCVMCAIMIVCLRLATSERNGKLSGCWADNFIPYRISDGFLESQISHITEIISMFHKDTCLRWMDIDHEWLNWNVTKLVQFDKNEANECTTYTSVPGSIVFIKFIVLSDRCFHERSVLHEMMHALDFYHEHQRADRNCYVVVDESMEEEPQYKIVRDNENAAWLERFPYDKYSVMHYRRSNKMRTITEKWYQRFWNPEPLGNVKGELTFFDLWKLLYKYCKFPHFCDIAGPLCWLIDRIEKDCP